MSLCDTAPKSPWYASRGFMKNDGVPVLDSVAAIFAPMCPLFPTPVTTTFPSHSSIIFTALLKLSSSLGMRASMAWASSVRHFTAYGLTSSMLSCAELLIS